MIGILVVAYICQLKLHLYICKIDVADVALAPLCYGIDHLSETVANLHVEKLRACFVTKTKL